MPGVRDGTSKGSDMNGKIARIEGMMAAGWQLEDIVSDHGAVEVLFRRGKAVSTVVLDQQDAWDVLYGSAFEREGPPARAAVEITR